MIRKLFEKFFLKKNTENNNLKQSIETVLDNDLKGTEGISKHERLMLLNILKIDGIRSSDIMIPRADIGAVELNDSFEKVLEVFIKEAHSRVPIYEKNLDNIIGMIHIKDLVNYQKSATKIWEVPAYSTFAQSIWKLEQKPMITGALVLLPMVFNYRNQRSTQLQLAESMLLLR